MCHIQVPSPKPQNPEPLNQAAVHTRTHNGIAQMVRLLHADYVEMLLLPVGILLCMGSGVQGFRSYKFRVVKSSGFRISASMLKPTEEGTWFLGVGMQTLSRGFTGDD